MSRYSALHNYRPLLVPVGLLTESVRCDTSKQVRLFIYLKAVSDGLITKEHTRIVASDFNISEKTLKRHIGWLMVNNWIGADSDNYYLRSWARIDSYINFKSGAGVYLDKFSYVTDQEMYLAWATGATIAQAIRWQKRVKYHRERNKGRSVPRWAYHAVSNSLLAKILDCSLRRAIDLKRLAKERKFIESKAKFELVDIKGDAVAYQIIKAKRQDAGCDLVIRNKKVFKQLVSEITPLIHVKRKRTKRAPLL